MHLLPVHREMPLAISTAFVEALRSAAVLDEAIEAVQAFKRDAMVRIVGGPFLDRLARVVSSNRRSTRVKLEMFGRETITVVSTADLAAVAEV